VNRPGPVNVFGMPPGPSNAAATGPLVATIVSLQVGKVGVLNWRGREIESAFSKQPIAGPVDVTGLGLTGDEQGDMVNHGGRDKAVCVYPAEHYAYWNERLGLELGPAGFGENLTVSGARETEVCIGDVYTCGHAAFEVSQPRQPCFKIAATYGIKALPAWVQQSGYTGYYLRVLAEGAIGAGEQLRLEQRPHPTLSVAEANRVMHDDKNDRAGLRALLVPQLSESWTKAFTKRLEGGGERAAERLGG
jgi:MOSC domain-containing protein YiiM